MEKIAIEWTKEYYTYEQLDAFLNTLPKMHGSHGARKNKKTVYYKDIICVMDTETTSYYHPVYGKTAWMYEWSLCVNGEVIIGREWWQYHHTMAKIREALNVDMVSRLPVYVHNLAFDWQFFARQMQWADIFAIDARTPVRALTTDGFEYRCSYILSGLPVAKMEVPDTRRTAMLIPPSKLRKMVGDLDYRKVRTPETVLSDEEIKYCINDVRVVAEWLAQKLADNNDTLASVPMTRTGYVRRDCRRATVNGKNGKIYRSVIQSLKLDYPTYMSIKEVYAGGFTHADHKWVGYKVPNVRSYDLTSSYPTVMVAKAEYSISSFLDVYPTTMAEFDKYLQNNCCMFTVRMRNVRPTQGHDHESPISLSHCRNRAEIEKWEKDGVARINNGRVYESPEVIIRICEIDYRIFRKFYDFDITIDDISDMMISAKGYLPAELIDIVLQYYELKTTLKNVPGEETMYAKYKEYVNSLYGMCATDVLKDVNIFDGNEWKKEALEPEELERVNASKNRFLFFAWSYQVTALARERLFGAIEELGDDYLYSDTDSVKFINPASHQQYFDDANAAIIADLQAACAHHGIDPARISPKNRKKKHCPLGVWDYDGDYLFFKTLGAKRYMYTALEEIMVDEYDDDGPTGRKIGSGWFEKRIHTTVAGLSKKQFPTFLETTSDPYDTFDVDLTVPKEYTGKLTHTYIDEKHIMMITDYQGHKSKIKTHGMVHLEPQEYHMGMADSYARFLGWCTTDNKDIDF